MIYLFSNSRREGVRNMPLLEFDVLIKDIDLLNYDMLLFTSKNTVKILNDINQQWKLIPSIAIGEESAKTIIELGGNLAFVSNGYSEELAKDIKKLFSDKKILYIRPKTIATNYITDINKDRVHIDEIVLYETVCKKYDISQKPSLNSTLIFTSPSTIKCFLDNFGSLDGYDIIAIGKTTAKTLPVGVKYHIPDMPNIDVCIKLAKSFSNPK